MSDGNVLAIAGVGCSHEEIVAATQGRDIFIALDTDYYENHYVARVCARLTTSISVEMKLGFQNRIRIFTWNPKIKGIDDALLQNAVINSYSSFEWYESLSRLCQSEFSQIFPKMLAAV